MATEDWSQALRNQVVAWKASGGLLAEITEESGIPQASLSDFAAGRGGLTLVTAQRLAAFWGIRLTKPRKRKPRRDARTTRHERAA